MPRNPITITGVHERASFSGDEVLRVARAIWNVRPDCTGKPWPLETEAARRAYPHNPIAAVDLCIAYAKAALREIQ